MSATAQLEVYSLPEICALLQEMPGSVRSVMSALGIGPSYRVHGQDCWSREQVDQIETFLSDKDSK